MSAYREPGETDVYYEDPKPLPKREPWPHWDHLVSALLVAQAAIVIGLLVDYHDVHGAAHRGLTTGVGVISAAVAIVAFMRKVLIHAV